MEKAAKMTDSAQNISPCYQATDKHKFFLFVFFSTFKHAQGCNLWGQVVYFCLREPAENTF